MQKSLKKIALASIFIVGSAFPGCQSSAKNYSVVFVEREDGFPFENSDRKTDPLVLRVEVDEDGNLSLNQIETGTIADPSLLAAKLKVIFDDREKASIREREVIIEPRGEIKNENVKKLIENLASVKASPIRVIKKNMPDAPKGQIFSKY